jgi:hypothetical protein
MLRRSRHGRALQRHEGDAAAPRNVDGGPPQRLWDGRNGRRKDVAVMMLTTAELVIRG